MSGTPPGRHGLLPVAGIGLVAGPGTQASRAAMPHPAHPATVVMFAGTADPLIPYVGGPIGPLGRLVQRRGGGDTDRGLAVAAAVIAADWATSNGIDGTANRACVDSARRLISHTLNLASRREAVSLAVPDSRRRTHLARRRSIPPSTIHRTSRTIHRRHRHHPRPSFQAQETWNP